MINVLLCSPIKAQCDTSVSVTSSIKFIAHKRKEKKMNLKLLSCNCIFLFIGYSTSGTNINGNEQII